MPSNATKITRTATINGPQDVTKSLLVFPNEMRSGQFPFMAFSTLSPGRGGGGAGGDVYLPIPPGLTFSDAMSYSTINLGIIGSLINSTITGAKSALDISGGVAGLAGATVAKAKSLNSAAAASIATRVAHSDYADIIDFSSKQLISPNMNTNFTGSNVRSFGFSFKLVAKSATESGVIHDIVSLFRSFMYPTGTELVMSYPPMWSLKFFDAKGNENQYLPKIYDCFLTTMSATYNGSTNIFHDDGSPFETDVILGFQETKALTRENIDALETDGKAQNRAQKSQ